MPTVSFGLSNKINFPTIDEPDEFESGRFESAYGNLEYSFDVSFSVEVENFSATVTDILPLIVPEFVNVQVISSDTIRISKNEVNAFIGEFYKFVRFDENNEKIIQTLEPGDQSVADSIIEWNPPPIKILEDVLHSFRIFYTSTETPLVVQEIVFSALQDVHWNLEISLSNFENLVQESRY